MTDSNSPVSLAGIANILKKWKRQIGLFVLLITVTATVISFVLPKTYSSVVTILPVKAELSDKARFFNNNIEQLYAAIGGSNDLDRIMGTAKLDTIYRFITDSFSLTKHYDFDGADPAYKASAFYRLKKNTELLRTENGELKIMVWDISPAMAANIANAMAAKIDDINRGALNSVNKAAILQMQISLDTCLARLQQMDNSKANLTQSGAQLLEQQRVHLLKQTAQYQQQIDELGFMLNANTPSVLVLEKASPAFIPGRPHKTIIVAGALVLSLLFAITVAVVLETFKK
jgi:capsular polysaccharide biosynthesis protein